MKRMVVMVFALALVCAAALPLNAQAPAPGELVKQMKNVMEPPQASARQLTFTTLHKGARVTFGAMQANETAPDGKRMLLVVREPAVNRGIALLMWERGNNDTPIYLYLPAMKRVVEEQGMQAYEPFEGTTFTYSDLVFIQVHETYRLLGEEAVNGARAYKVEETIPRERGFYSRIVTWIAADSRLPLRRDYYDRAGNLWKTELFRDIAVVDGVPTAMDIVMKDVQSGDQTELKLAWVNYNVKVPPDIFEAPALNKAVDHPVWQTFVAQGGGKQ